MPSCPRRLGVSSLSVRGVSVEVLHEYGDKSLLEELMDDFMALLASFSGRLYNCGPGRISSGCSTRPLGG